MQNKETNAVSFILDRIVNDGPPTDQVLQLTQAYATLVEAAVTKETIERRFKAEDKELKVIK